MSKAQDLYEQVLNDAIEHVFIAAVRNAMDTRLLAARFDIGRGPGPHAVHTLNVAIRDTDISVSAHISVSAQDIPHEWLSMGTGYIDTRFSQRIALLLQDLDKKARIAGRFI